MIRTEKPLGVVRDACTHLCPLGGEIDKLRGLVLADTTVPFHDWLRRCKETFEGFHRCVQEHVEYESSLGVHERLAELAPELSCPARDLEREHAQLLAECDQIATQLASMLSPDLLVERELVNRLENVIALFRRHTARELEIASEALGDASITESTADLAQRPCPHGQHPHDTRM